MNTTLRLLAILAITLTAVGNTFAHDTSVRWQTLGNEKDAAGKVSYTQRFTITGDTDFSRLGFNMFARRMEPVEKTDTLVELMPGYYYIASPRFNGSDTVVVDIRTRAAFNNICYAPDGVHRINADGTSRGVNYMTAPFDSSSQWSTPGKDLMPYGEEIYAQNERLNAGDFRPGVYDVIPSYKKVTYTGGTSRVPRNPVFVDIVPENPEFYTITVRNDSVIIACRPDRQWAVYYPFKAKVLMANGEKPLPNAVITDWPDHLWRGQHIDIARNFQSPATMHKVLEILAVNHLNKLHFHLVDDEAWRLEIPGMPELTEVGSRRGYSADGEKEFLYQVFAGDGNPDSPHGTANGYWTRDEFIEFIRRAHVLGIDVLPEIESPGHARAAIKAMEKRHRNGDDTYRLIHDGDTSVYTSAQSFHDNVMNPALPGPYAFMEKVFDEIIAMYADAGVPLIGIHIGGDEVPRGAWSGSSVARTFMEEHGMTSEKELHAWFVRRMAQALRKRGVPMYGWEEVAVGHGKEFNNVVRPAVDGVNCWHQTPDAAMAAVKAGYPVILCNVNRFYLDMAYSRHPQERGLTWGGTVDEFDALNGYPAQLCPLDADEVRGKGVIGVQGQLWAETIRGESDLTTLLLPKITGMAERAWNADTTYTDSQFNTIVAEKELPLYTSEPGKLKVHMRQPGIRVADGKVYMNAPYSGGEIRYTLDGTEPTEQSALYIGPFEAPEYSAGIRARYYRNGCASVTTWANP